MPKGQIFQGIYICPHRPDENCPCRKPNAELAQQAAADLHFDLQEAFVIGDQPGDPQMGRACGATTVLVRTGYGSEWERNGLQADFIADDLSAAAASVHEMLGLVSDGSGAICRPALRQNKNCSNLAQELCCERLESCEIASPRENGNCLLCGNGGSAADAQHIAAEFVSVLNENFIRPGLAAIALPTDSSVLTASANDFGFAGVFERQCRPWDARGTW